MTSSTLLTKILPYWLIEYYTNDWIESCKENHHNSEYYEIDSIEMKVEFDFLLNSVFKYMHSFTLFCLYIIVPKVLISDVSCFISNYSRYHTDYQYLCQNWLLILCSFIILHSFIHSKFQSLYLAHYFKHWVSKLL